jgi:hypothetical protein
MLLGNNVYVQRFVQAMDLGPPKTWLTMRLSSMLMVTLIVDVTMPPGPES